MTAGGNRPFIGPEEDVSDLLARRVTDDEPASPALPPVADLLADLPGSGDVVDLSVLFAPGGVGASPEALTLLGPVTLPVVEDPAAGHVTIAVASLDYLPGPFTIVFDDGGGHDPFSSI